MASKHPTSGPQITVFLGADCRAQRKSERAPMMEETLKTFIEIHSSFCLGCWMQIFRRHESRRKLWLLSFSALLPSLQYVQNVDVVTHLKILLKVAGPWPFELYVSHCYLKTVTLMYVLK